MTTPFWDWAVAGYGAPGVEDACLELQDAGGQNVPLLLWAAWCAATGRRVDRETIEAACDAARAWETTAVAPLRAVRRTLKTRSLDMDDADREAIRAQVKAVELEAERRLMAHLAGLSPDSIGAPRPVLDAMIAVSREWGRSVPRAGLDHLAQTLPA
jgi:uncharacterized protein (TIGR02444 family)